MLTGIGPSSIGSLNIYQPSSENTGVSGRKSVRIFEALSLRFRDVVPTWEKMESMPFLRRDGKPRSLFQVNFVQVPLKHSQSKRLTGANSQAARTRINQDGCAELITFMEEAMELELVQAHIREQASMKSSPDTLNDSRRNLRKAINWWRLCHQDETLELPSSYNADLHQQFGLKTLAQFEHEIRLGHAYDTIDDMRTTIHIYNAGTREKRLKYLVSAHCAGAILASLKNNIRECAKRYRLSYAGLLALGLHKNSELKPIGDDELWGKDMTSTSKPGDSKRKEPWYWVIGKPRDLLDAAWELEQTVRSFRMRAARYRYREELEILDKEFRCTQLSFAQTSRIWKDIGEKQYALRGDGRVACGHLAFAHGQAAMYQKLADGALEHWYQTRTLSNTAD